jgi:hypothetical protein
VDPEFRQKLFGQFLLDEFYLQAKPKYENEANLAFATQ